MGLLDFLKKDEYKSGNQGGAQPVNLGQQPTTQSPLLQGAQPAPIPGGQVSNQNINNSGGVVNSNQDIQADEFSPVQDQTQPYQGSFNPPPGAVQPDYLDNYVGTDAASETNEATPIQDYTQNTEDETLFGDGQLSDIYSQNYPDPNNIQPTMPGGMDSTQYVNTGQTEIDNVDSTAEQVSQSVDNEFEAQTETPMQENANGDTLQNTNNIQVGGSAPQFQVPELDMDSIMASVNKSKTESENKSPTQTGQIEQASDIPQAQEIMEDETKPNQVENPKLNISGRNIFSKIALLGLNGPNSASLDVEGINNLVAGLSAQKVEIIMDTDKGIASQIMSSMSNSKSKISTIALRPIMSSEGSEMTSTESKTNNFAVIYSNYIEWLKHLTKEARAFIVFDGAGTHNHAVLLNLVNISRMYANNGKPIILIGESWRMKIDKLKKDGLFSDADLVNITMLNNTDEAPAKLSELNSKYSSVDEPNYARVVDRRVEGDEKDFIVY